MELSITGSHWQIRISASSYELFFLSFMLLMRGCHPGPWGGPSTRPSPSPPHPHLISLSLLKVVFVYFWLCWIFVAAGLSLVAASGELLSSWSPQAFRRGDFSCRAWALGAQAPGAVVPRLSCSAARGTFPDQGSDRWRWRWRWQAGSYPPDPQGSPASVPGLQSPALGFRHPAAPALAPPASA